MNQELILQKLNAIELLLCNQAIMQKEVLSLEEACKFLSLSASHIYKLTSTNQIPHYVPTGKKIYFNRSEIEQWLLKNRKTPSVDIEQQAANYLILNRRRM